ncbi:flagellar hook-associated protein FlgK [Citromicrobium bathyomarinum]|uniref:flagellar hook-associated protein FlgK n=1 Tax=Citromicrobium bathyomarinum TaxID=72174 RepID=UPI001E4B1FAC|nr:flagellar basal body rod C-terminal domain-containing protein [Citromicrobium bathyomarinum]MCD1623247.1 flagellar basal body protein [Citromicrobium bathyomarinum]
MSLSNILGTAVSGLSASQAGIKSVSNNIANISTPGYARERVSLSTGVTQGRINGVVIGEPTRIADRFLEQTVYLRAGDMGRAEVTANYMDRLQAFLGAPGAESGVPARLDAISASAIALTSGRSAPQNAASFVAEVQDAIGSIRQLDDDIQVLRGDVESEVGYSIETVNDLLERIHGLNATVAQLRGLGRSAGGAEDQRMSALEELSGLMKVSIREQPDGRVNIDSATGAVLLDGRLRKLSYPSPGDGVAQPTYPVIDIRFTNEAGEPTTATGEKLDSSAIGGKLGGLLDLRDRALPEFSDQLGSLFGGLAETLNSVSNSGTAVPPPNRLDGRPTGLIGGDRLGFTGQATFAVTDKSGILVASTTVDFDALGPLATVDDAIAAINGGLAGNATVALQDGRLSFVATSGSNGVAVAQGDPPSARAGNGFSHYFGLNDVVRSESATLVAPGFVASDPHGFGAGQSAQLVLRDATGRSLATTTLTGTVGPTMGDLVTELGQSPLAKFGSFALDDRGRISFTPSPGASGSLLSIPTDSTDRFGTGVSFTALSGLTGGASGLNKAGVRSDVLASGDRLPLSRLRTDAAVGEPALGGGDTRVAGALVEALGKPIDFGKAGSATIERFSSLLMGRAGTQAARAQDMLVDAAARRDDAINRRDSFSGVNLDEELSQMVVLQNSYSAAARVMTTATQMYDTLLDMVR